MSRSPAAQRIVGLALGAVVLGLLVLLAVGLPKAQGEDAGEAQGEAQGGDSVSLPDDIEKPIELRALDLTDGASGEELDQAEQTGELLDSAAERLEELFDASAAVRAYGDADQQVQVTITVIAAEAGPFAPGGPPVDPELLGAERYTNELVEVGGGVCAVYWDQPIAEGEPIPEGDPSGLQCQLEVDGQTRLLQGGGLDAETAIEILQDLPA